MKTYQQPSTTAIQLSSSRGLCQDALVVSFGSNVNVKYGGESGTGYKPM